MIKKLCLLSLVICLMTPSFASPQPIQAATQSTSQLPSKAQLTGLKAKKKAFKISFQTKDASSITGYLVQYTSKKSFKSFKSRKISKTHSSAIIDGLKGGKTYYVRICTYKKTALGYEYSPWTKTKSITTCKYLVAIDAGHQQYANTHTEPLGPGSSIKKIKVAGGARGISTKQPEYKLTLQVAKKLQKQLESRGYEVYQIRKKNNVNISNVTRAKKANKKKADLFLRIHANGSTSSSVHGAQTICMTSHNPYNANLYKKSLKLSKAVLKAYTAKTKIKSEGVKTRDDLSGTNWSQVPVTLIELGYLSNSTEDQKMASPTFQKKMAKGIADGIDAYFKK